MSGSSNGNAATGNASFRNVEELVRSLVGVLAAQVLTDALGRVASIHVAASDAYEPAEIARNVRSALLARLGLAVDARAIHVRSVPAAAAVAAGDPSVNAAAPPAPRPSPLAERAGLHVGILPRPDPRPGLHGFELERRHPNHVSCRVVLTLGDHAYTGEADALDAGAAPLEVAARATLAALRAAAGGSADALELDGVRTVSIADRTYVVAAVRLFHGRSVRSLAGAAAIETSAEYTAALATLHATNRWLGGRLWESVSARMP